MEISVIIVAVENDKKLLPRCLKALKLACHKAGLKTETIVVANATSLSLPVNLKKGIKILNLSENGGLGTAVNSAMETVKNKWVLLLCPDVELKDNSLKILIKETADRIGIIAPRVLINDQTQETILPIPSLWQIFLEQSFLYRLFPSIFRLPFSDKLLYQKKQKVSAAAAICWLFQKKAYRLAGGFDERFFLYFEDVDLCRRIKRAGFEIIYQPAAAAFHFPHASTGGQTDGSLYVKSLKKILGKYHNQLYVILSMFIFAFGSSIRLILWSVLGNRKKINFLTEAIRESLFISR